MRNFSYIIGFSLLLLISSCLEEFTPEVVGAEKSIVVEGQILQGTGGAKVKLSLAFDFDRRKPVDISNAEVWIRDDQGNETQLSQPEPGLYVSDTAELKGIPGRSYQLYAKVPPLSEIQSEWMLMQESSLLENTDYEFQRNVGGVNPKTGVQVFLDAYDPTGETEYYRWEYEETWEFRVPYPLNGTWNSQTNTPTPIPFNERPYVCYKSVNSSRILLGTTDGLSENRIARYPVQFISTSGNQLYIKYSILVKQYSINKETYEFWRRLKGVTEDLGTLFDPVPTEVVGNLVDLNQSDLPVLGFFSADGYQEKRLFIKRSDLPPVGIPNGFSDCVYDTVPRSEVNSNLIQGNLFVEEIFSPFGMLIGFGVTQAKCADCTLSGFIEKPDFWD